MRRIFQGGVSGVASKVIALLVSAVSLPLTVRYLGRLEYGVWVTISTTVTMLALLDLGIANTLTTLISEAYAREDQHGARRYYSTAFWMTVGIVAVLTLVCLGVWRRVDWGALLHLQSPMLIEKARVSVLIAMVFFLATMPLSLANRVLGGYQQVHLGNYFAMVNSLLGLVAIVTAILLHGNIVMLMGAYCGSLFVGGLLLNLWLLFWHKPWLRPHPGLVDWTVVRSMLGQGSLFFVLQLTGVVVFSSDNLVISHYLGAAEVTPYSVAWRLTGYAGILQAMMVPSMWPAFAEAYERRDLGWIRQNYRRFSRGSLGVVGVAGLVIGLLGRPVIRLWAGAAAVPGSLLLWSMCAWVVLLAATISQAAIMAATQRLGVQAVCAVAAACANLALSIVLVQRIGAIGVVLASIGSYLVFIIIPQSVEVRRILSGRYLAKRAA